MNWHLSIKLLPIMLTVACADETFVHPNGNTIQVFRRHGMVFDGFDTESNGMPRFTFTLKNTTQYQLCLISFINNNQYGSFDFFLDDSSSYSDTVGFIAWNPPVDPYMEAQYYPTGREVLINPGNTIEITRTFDPSIYLSQAGVNMIAGSKFAGAFEGKLDLYAELSVSFHKCNPDYSWSEPSGDYYEFSSGMIGPFRIDIPLR